MKPPAATATMMGDLTILVTTLSSRYDGDGDFQGMELRGFGYPAGFTAGMSKAKGKPYGMTNSKEYTILVHPDFYAIPPNSDGAPLPFWLTFRGGEPSPSKFGGKDIYIQYPEVLRMSVILKSADAADSKKSPRSSSPRAA